ncbi:uracil-DNA glycosylase family protein [Thermodesulfobacteriota bacterium]
MQEEKELKEIIGHLWTTMEAYSEMGIDPPPVLKSSLKSEIRRDIPNDLDKEARAQIGSLEHLKEHIGECRRCKLHKGRTNLVFGEGASRARLVFIGEGPGQDEDKLGKPFVGEAGRLLTRIIESGMGLKREDVFICNVVKCRPPGNRDPETDEIKACLPFLKHQLRLIKPEVICSLGRVAARVLLGEHFKVTRDRGKWYSYMGLPVMPTYHPAYILRNPARERDLKGQVWKDVQLIMKHLELEVKKNA